MFIEGLRRAKSKWRIGVSILLGLIIVSLVLSFAYFGQTMGGTGVTETASPLEAAESAAETAAAAANDAAGDATVLGNAAAAYLSLAAYQELYLEDSADSYAAALDYANQMVAACGTTPEADYATAYSYVFEAYMGMGDAAGLSAAFNEALKVVTLDESFIDTYYRYMNVLGDNELLIADLTTAKDLADKAAPAEDETAAEGEAEEGEATEEVSLSQHIEDLIVSANVEQATE